MVDFFPGQLVRHTLVGRNPVPRPSGFATLPVSAYDLANLLLFLMSLGLFLGRSEKPMWLEDVVRAYSAVGGREAFLYVVSLVETMF